MRERGNARLLPGARKGVICMAATKTFKVTLWGETWELRVHSGQYASTGNTAVELENSVTEAGDKYWEPFAKLSVNLDAALPAGHFYLKDYSENEVLVAMPEIQALYTPCEVHGPESSGYVTLSCQILKA